ncbi:MAG: amidase domain-containing protein [Pseudonocardiaceae bacterium]
MVSFSQLRDAKPGLWQDAADDWLAGARHSARCADEIRARGSGPLVEHWQDKVGQLAGAMLADLATKFEVASDVMQGAAMVLDALAESISLAQRTLRRAIEDAQEAGYLVAEDGSLRQGPVRLPGMVDYLSVRSRIDEALREASQADQKAAAALNHIQDSVGMTDPAKAINEVQVQASHDQMDILRADIPVGQDSQMVKNWWASLTAQQQQQLELAVPTVLAGLDGIPEDVKNTLRGDGSKYDRIKLVQWALDHSNDTSIDAFEKTNCANFVSTALRESGVQEKNNGWGTLSSGNWVEGMQTGWKSLDQRDFSHSATWTRADKLHDFLASNGGQEVALDQVRPGDVIFFEQDSPNSEIPQGQIHHAAIVTAVTPDGDIKYTQHSDNEQNLSLSGRELHENTTEGHQNVHAVRVNPNWY